MPLEKKLTSTFYYPKSYDSCPICNEEMINIKRLNKYCLIANGKNMSFIESVCNRVDLSKPSKEYPFHLYFQVSSLFEDIFYYSVYFPDTNRFIDINYINQMTKIIYYSKYTEGTTDIPPKILEYKKY